jgi:hypothetical protein
VATPAGFENKIAFVWKIADKLRGHLKQHEYGTVLLPTLVMFRLDSVLAPTKAAVIAKASKLDLNAPGTDPLLRRAAGELPFYNTSPLSLHTMLSDDKNIAAQMQAYVAAFSPSAAEVLDAFQYQKTITRLDKAGVLYAILADFADLDLHPNSVSDEAMGYIFEELLRKFLGSETFVLPVLTYTVPEAAAHALRWRQDTLPMAKDSATQPGLAGAAFPWRTIAGAECSSYWPAGTAAFHIGADIADAVTRYIAATPTTFISARSAPVSRAGTVRSRRRSVVMVRSGNFSDTAVLACSRTVSPPWRSAP